MTKVPPIFPNGDPSKSQVCRRCDTSKPATTEFWVRNRPTFSRGMQMSPTFHSTCKACESEAKVAAWAKRREAQEAEWARENAALEARARVAMAEAARQRALAEELKESELSKYQNQKFRPLGEDT